METLDGYVLGTYLAKKLSLHRKYFDRIDDSEHFSIMWLWGHCYVKPSQQIVNLLKSGYIAVPLNKGDDEKEFGIVIQLKRHKLGFWKGDK
ncbi:MAG: hypothetical protein LBD84_07350 [Campylobacteraceae bacterium]|nr:hypothetical protein [Campylobacteraceae bacterium]